MRIIAGALKGRRLEGPAQGELEVRPTADRAREALFSILQAWPSGAFVDLFGGTGAVALEAFSRGYGPVVCVESKPRSFLLKNLKSGNVRLLATDAAKLGADAFSEVAVLFSDPPYERSAEFWEKLAPRIRPWIAKGGILVWETDARTALALKPEWEPVDTRRYGTAQFHFFEGR